MVVLVLPTVTVEVAAPLVTSTELELRLQVAGLVGLLGLVVTAQVRPTLPVKPFAGVTVTIEVLPVVAPATRLKLDGAAPSEKPGEVEPPLATASIASVCT